MYQKRILPYIIIPYFLTPSFFPFGALQTDGRTVGQISTPLSPLFLFFFPLSARGPTRRRNSTGLAELWGGWPIEREGGAVRGRREDEMAARREATQQPACAIRRMWFVMRLADSNVPPRFDPAIWIAAVLTNSFELRKE